MSKTKPLSFNIIGAGAAATHITLSLVSLGHHVNGILSRSIHSANTLATKLNYTVNIVNYETILESDITFITTPDDEITNVVSAILESKKKPSKLVVHLSGVMDSTILSPLKNMGCDIASIHPIKALLINTSPNFENCFMTLEGDLIAVECLKNLFAPFSPKFIDIASEKKALYHAACVMASNYLVTLAHEAQESFQKSGMPQELAKEMTLRLMQTNLDNMQKHKSLSNALTGPITRGDISTIYKHLEALNPEQKPLYKILGLRTLSFVQHKRNIIKALSALFII